MPITTIRPSTVDGIKQLAKKLKREHDITHTEALALASRQAGFENFVHARRRLTSSHLSAHLAAVGGQRVFPVFLSAHWFSSHRANPKLGLRAGREILQVNLSRPLPQVVAKHRVSYARGLEGFRIEYDDHLEHLTDLPSIETARDVLIRAARSLSFMEATGLQPVTRMQERDVFLPLEGLPGQDHTSRWFDPDSGNCVLLDEPYERAIANRDDERHSWLTEERLHIRKPAWAGLYYPGECPPYLISFDVAFLERIVAALEAIEPDSIPDIWPHETGGYGDDYISPKRLVDGKSRKPRPGPSYRNYKGATPYGGAPGIRSRWRPVKPMPLELHQQLGELIRRLAELPLSWRTGSKLRHQRLLLEDWANKEHCGAFESSVIDNLYYGVARHPAPTDHAKCLAMVAEARALVEQGYDDCKPRRTLISVLDEVATEIAGEAIGKSRARR